MTPAAKPAQGWPRRRALTAAGQLSVALAFDAFAIAQTSLIRSGAREFAPAPSTVIIFKHTSDLDLPVLVRALFRPHVLAVGAGRMSFVARGDLYQRGFLALYFPQLGPFRRLLYRFNVGPILVGLNVLPANGSGALLVADWLAQLIVRYGPAARLRDCLSSEGVTAAEAAGLSGWMTLAAARAWRFHRWLEQPSGAGMLSARVSRALRLVAAHRAQAQLEGVASGLAAGSMLLLAPEGGLSPDGSLMPFRGVLHRLLHRVPHATVQPVGVSYDLPNVSRPRVVLRLGEPLYGLGALPRQESERRIRTALLRETTITLAHVAGEAAVRMALTSATAVPLDSFASGVYTRSAELAQAGLPVDERLLGQEGFRQTFRGFLQRAQGRGLTRRGSLVQFDKRILLGAVSGSSGNPLGFARRELESILGEAWSEPPLSPALSPPDLGERGR